MLFGGRSNPMLAARIGDELAVERGRAVLETFSNGEMYCRFLESVRGADVFIVQSICANPDAGINANDALMELLVMIDAAVGASAHEVVAVTPWYGYARQDKKAAPREPISARLVARMLEAAGIDRLLTMDLHAGQIQGFFQRPCDHMTALFTLAAHVRDERTGDLVVVAPDAGRAKLARRFAHHLDAGLAILDKQRPARQAAEMGHLIGDVRGRTALIVDDMIDTGGTLRAAAGAVRGAGATRVLAAATHPVLSGDASRVLGSAPIDRILVTDTIPVPSDAPRNLRVLSCSELLASSIRQIFTEGSVSGVFGGENQPL